MVGFDEYLLARGGELMRLARALAAAEQPALDLVHSALAEARRDWARLAGDDPHPLVRHGVVRGYLSPWRRPGPGRADDPLARLGRRERAVVVLQHLCGLSYVEIAEHMGGSPSAAARLWEKATATVPEPQVLAALEQYGSFSPGVAALTRGAQVAGRARARRRLAVAGAVVAVIAAVAALLATLPEKPEPQPTPPPRPSPVRMIPAIYDIPKFPYVATYLPAGATAPTVFQDGQVVGIDYGNVVIRSFPVKPEQPAQSVVEQVWERDGRWLRLTSDRLSIAEADRVAGGLEPGEVTMQLPPFTISLMPAGYVLRRASPQSICLAAQQDQPSDGLCVTALPDILGQASWPVQPIAVSVQGRRADLIYPHGVWAELWIHLEERDVIRVSMQQKTPQEILSAEDLQRFAEGILVSGGS